MRWTPAKRIVAGTLTVFVVASWLARERIRIEYYGWQLRHATATERERWLHELEDRTDLLHGMSFGTFLRMVGLSLEARPEGFVPRNYQRIEIEDVSALGDIARAHEAWFVGGSLVLFYQNKRIAWSSPDPYGEPGARLNWLANQLNGSASLSDPSFRSLSFALARERDLWIPRLIPYLHRCPDARSRALGCLALHYVTGEDLPPTPEAWSAWWAKRKPSP